MRLEATSCCTDTCCPLVFPVFTCCGLGGKLNVIDSGSDFVLGYIKEEKNNSSLYGTFGAYDGLGRPIMVVSKSRASACCNVLFCSDSHFLVEGTPIPDNCITGEESCLVRTGLYQIPGMPHRGGTAPNQAPVNMALSRIPRVAQAGNKAALTDTDDEH